MAYLRKPLSTWISPSTSDGLQAGAPALVPHRFEELDRACWCSVLRCLSRSLARAEPAQVGQALVDVVEARLAAARRRPPQPTAPSAPRRPAAPRPAPARVRRRMRQRTRQQRQRRGQQRAARRRHAAERPCTLATASASGITVAAASRRPCTSTVPSFRPRSEITTRMRHADQFPVGEHRAGALAAVVEHDVDAGRREFVVQASAAACTSSLRS